ncbi:MAG: cobalt-precorrin-5B (C(1))-methyltransferase [Hydrogenophilus thermoluteolus]|uniref:cobalt-precorrin-5B (C(1))-methyltransferase n=1 Tax=Hydrogenophilus thermoluteolus TaxID=297 RepID=UPI001C6431D2|nr:cobalt-precorrin-5B (C(1))-methyltransferase [Hydrogenophilus thermoluteolus]MBW7656114.1 cobalt-precorrin-5B (C(1))-methyltransferase [Hydrogenophilus thermoluteolus]HNQ48595.1 cobalt-precorrin-5B (C(1))-methyltransferase [Hydrogenophilus thermoluteolus]
MTGHADPNAKRRAHRGRTGFTTGACAAAAARAAAQGLLTGAIPDAIETKLPNGQRVVFPIHEKRLYPDGRATAVVIKDAGDDPDVTDKAPITATVAWVSAPGLFVAAGEGVGIVTRPGIGLPVGEPAINPVPRQNLCENLSELLGAAPPATCAALPTSPLPERAVCLTPELPNCADHGLLVTIAVPGGETLAKRTLNPRLGIVGGISILGTTGIVRPYSTAAFRASVVQAIGVARAQGCDTVVLTTGGRTEKAMMALWPELPEAAFVQMGDFVRTAFDAARKNGIRHLIIGAMVGKLTKMAQGMPVTHAGKGEVDRTLLADCARAVGAPSALVAEIAAAETARFAAERLAELGLDVAFHSALAARAWHTLKTKYWPGSARRLTIQTVDFAGNAVARIDESTAPQWLAEWEER